MVEGGIHHVHNRAASGEEIFSNPETAMGFLAQCKDLAGVLGKNPGVVSYRVVEAVRRRSEDAAFAGRYDDPDEKLEISVKIAGERRQLE